MSAISRFLLSGLFVVHLTGVFVAPLTSSISTALGRLPDELRPQRTATPWLLNVLQPYLDIAYLNHGYGFFAPDPGPSHLIRYTVEWSDGRTIHGQLPDRNRHWPRLLYHRHFMLAEQVMPGSPQAYGRHLLAKHGADRVQVERVRHYLARPEEVLAGAKLDAPASYESSGHVTVEASEIVTEGAR